MSKHACFTRFGDTFSKYFEENNLNDFKEYAASILEGGREVYCSSKELADLLEKEKEKYNKKMSRGYTQYIKELAGTDNLENAMLDAIGLQEEYGYYNPDSLNTKIIYDPKIIHLENEAFFIKIPEGIEYINTESCSKYSSHISIEKIDLSNVTNILYRAFANNKSLKEMIIPPSVEDIKVGAFDDSAVENIIFEGDIDRVNRSFSSAWYNRSNLKSITFKGNVKEFDSEAFKYCSELTTITVSSENIKELILSSCELPDSCEVIVDRELEAKRGQKNENKMSLGLKILDENNIESESLDSFEDKKTKEEHFIKTNQISDENYEK